MIDTDALEKQFEKKCLDAGLVKLDEPVDLFNVLNISSKIDDWELFNTCWWQPAMYAMMMGISKEYAGEFHRVSVTLKDNDVLVFSVSH